MSLKLKIVLVRSSLSICNYNFVCKIQFQCVGIRCLKGQSHEKVGEMSVWGISLGPN
jgi:hypothetical protein